MCLGTFGHLARSLATIYIFARVRISGTLVPHFYKDLNLPPETDLSAGGLFYPAGDILEARAFLESHNAKLAAERGTAEIFFI